MLIGTSSSDGNKCDKTVFFLINKIKTILT